MIRILGISGSLRAGSFNTALLHAAQAAVGAGATIEAATLHGVPLYDADVEARDGTPAAVRALKERILSHDALLLVTPEYNNGVPGVFKNAVDWLSRPTPGLPDVFRDRPVGLIGASAGGFGTILAQAHWLPVLRFLGTRPWTAARLVVARAGSVFGADAALQDDAVRRQLAEYLEGFVAFVAAQRR
jgi:chromate reductase